MIPTPPGQDILLILPDTHPAPPLELGPLPEGWEVVRLEQVSNLTRKPRNLVLKKFSSVAFIPMEHISQNGSTESTHILKPLA